MEGVGKIAELGRSFEEGISLGHAKKKQAAKSLLNNAGIFLGVFLVFAVIIIVTTDIRLATWEELAGLGIDFLLLFFCTYTMYVNCSDSGMRHGFRTDDYINAVEKFDKRKDDIVGKALQTRMYEFCRHFIAEELKYSKMTELAVVGYTYEEYLEHWLGMDKEAVNEREDLSRAQKRAINKANSINPIRLTPEMILRRARGYAKRSPLGMNPETKKHINFGVKFVTTLALVAFMTIIVFEWLITPTWPMFASCMIKLITIIINGFNGYKFGYENIVFDTVYYMSDQTDLMDQAIQYFEDLAGDENSDRGTHEEGA